MRHMIIIGLISLLLIGCNSKSEDNESENPAIVETNSSYTRTPSATGPELEAENLREEIATIALEAADNWYIRLIAEAPQRGLQTYSAQFGALQEDDAAQKYSLHRHAPFTGNYLDIIFSDPEELEEGEYKAYFKQSTENSDLHWTFKVLSDDLNADIVLSWRGLFVLTPYTDTQGRVQHKEYLDRFNPILQKMQLVDVLTDDVIAVNTNGVNTSYTFNMQGSTSRSFRWELYVESITQEISNAPSYHSSRFVKEQTTIVKPVEFNMFSPPSF